MLVHIKDIVSQAKANNYGIGAFNTANLEVTLAIARGAEQSQAPVIIQVTEKTIAYAGLENIAAIIKSVAEDDARDIPVALHLDHGHTFETVKRCVQAGFSSVHIDASEKPFEENVALTKQVVEYAHQHDVWVQAELGRIFGKEGMVKHLDNDQDMEKYMTDPQEAKEFVAQTGVDTLAISVGTFHGSFAGKEKVNFKRLKKIRQAVDLPLVLHGASGVTDRQLSKSIREGISIVNIDTSLRIAFANTLQQTISGEADLVDPRKILAPTMDSMTKVVKRKIKLLGSDNKA